MWLIFLACLFEGWKGLAWQCSLLQQLQKLQKRVLAVGFKGLEWLVPCILKLLPCAALALEALRSTKFKNVLRPWAFESICSFRSL